jgi:hypothetical protein
MTTSSGSHTGRGRALAASFVAALIVLLMPSSLRAQGRPYEGPDDESGDVSSERVGYMNGNRVLISFRSNTSLAQWPNNNTSRWPNDATGTGMVDGIALLLGARVFVRNDSVPVSQLADVRAGLATDTLYFCQTNYYQSMDKSPDGTVVWGLEPVGGYFNKNSEYPAMSNHPESWPATGWPERGDGLKWPGEWNGRFGRGVKYAALESYFVANDAQDQEALQADNRSRYYPRPSRHIGDKHPDQITVQRGLPWGGLGIRVQVRGYQWNNPQTRDAIFWEYDISNNSEYDLPEMAFGYWLDNGIGHSGDQGEADDIAFFSKKENMAYSWDIDGSGVGNVRTGILGFAFLESPGIGYDNADNDNDGLVDERRDNSATRLVGPTDGIADIAKFLEFKKLTIADLKPHWDADEDGDWQDGVDANGNGVYDNDENPGDDVGTDGVGPNDLNYTGPDANGTECNHIPDFIEGLGCEPNFAVTDIDESDQLGLTVFKMFRHPGDRPPHVMWDKDQWAILGTPRLEEFFGELSNLIEEFGTGVFPVYKGRTERISVAEVHSYEDLNGLNAGTHSAPALFERKAIVQVIYETDYRFAQPPMTPTLHATASDGKVCLSWDEIADRLTREPLLRGKNDFEGYKLYRATDKYFSDAEQLHDMYGNPAGRKPIFQCDVKDGIKGASTFAIINGEPFYFGDDTGIRHSYVDENVQNGRTYYYAITAYDYGIPGVETSIAPSENNIVVDLDENEEIVALGSNVLAVTPNQRAAGYTPPAIRFAANTSSLVGGALVLPSVYDYGKINPAKTYKITFQVASSSYLRAVARTRHRSDGIYATNGYKVFDATHGDALLYEENPASYLSDNLVGGYFNVQYGLTSDVIDGVQLHIKPAVSSAVYDTAASGWIKGTSPLSVRVTPAESKYFAWDYRIVFTGVDTAYRGRTTLAAAVTDGNGAGVGNAGLLLRQPFSFYAVNTIFMDSLGQPEKMDLLIHDKNFNGVFDADSDEVLVGPVVKDGTVMRWGGTVLALNFRDAKSQMPKPGDVYHVAFKRPLSMVDSVMYRVEAARSVDGGRMQDDMKAIKVVPNPYIMTNALEPSVLNKSLNQRRRLLFTHVPAHSTIRVYTVSGVFIDEVVVDNAPENGAVAWDMLTKEGLEIAAGVYLFQVKSIDTGTEHLGKFAVLK